MGRKGAANQPLPPTPPDAAAVQPDESRLLPSGSQCRALMSCSPATRAQHRAAAAAAPRSAAEAGRRCRPPQALAVQNRPHRLDLSPSRPPPPRAPSGNAGRGAGCPIHAVSPHGWDFGELRRVPHPMQSHRNGGISEACTCPGSPAELHRLRPPRRRRTSSRSPSTPKSIRGYKLPPSSLSIRSDESSRRPREALRAEARTLVKKWRRVRSQRPGHPDQSGPSSPPSSSTPTPGVKYSRVTSLATISALAMPPNPSSSSACRQIHRRNPGPQPWPRDLWLRDV